MEDNKIILDALDKLNEKVTGDVDSVKNEVTELKKQISDINRNTVEVAPIKNDLEIKKETIQGINNALRQIQKNTLSEMVFVTNATNVEGTDSYGKYLVPSEIGDELIAKINQYGIAAANCTKKNMTRELQNFPTISTDLLAYNISEGGSISAVNYVFDQIQLAAQKWALIVPMSSELVADTVYDLYPELINSVGIQFALAQDTRLFTNTLSACTNTVTATITGAASVAITGTDLVSMISAVESQNIHYADDRAVFFMSPSIKAVLRSMKTTMGTFMFPQLSQGIDEIWNHKIITTNIMATASTTDTATPIIYFGNPEYAFYGDRNIYALELFREGTVGSDSLLAKDLVAYRALTRFDIKLSRPDAFCKLYLKA